MYIFITDSMYSKYCIIGDAMFFQQTDCDDEMYM